MLSWSRSVNYTIPVHRLAPLLAIFAVIGLCFLGLGVYFGAEKYWYLERAVEVPGEVVKLEHRRGSFAPIVRYTDQGGKSRILYPSSWSSPPQFYEGQIVGVLYDPTITDYPLTASINTFREKWQSAIFFLVFGGFWLFFVAMFWLASRPGKGKSARWQQHDKVVQSPNGET